MRKLRLPSVLLGSWIEDVNWVSFNFLNVIKLHSDAVNTWVLASTLIARLRLRFGKNCAPQWLACRKGFSDHFFYKTLVVVEDVWFFICEVLYKYLCISIDQGHSKWVTVRFQRILDGTDYLTIKLWNDVTKVKLQETSGEYLNMGAVVFSRQFFFKS